MFTKAKELSKLKVKYWDSDGTTVIFQGGNRPWRNQNPGNLGAGRWTTEHGAIGRAGGFAVFPNYEVGRRAIFDLLRRADFYKLSIWDAIPKYAPAKENDVAWYRKLVHDVTKLDLSRKIKDLSPKELESLVNAIERAEGRFKPGKIIKEKPISSSLKITSVRKNKKGTIVNYYVAKYGWLQKSRAIELASQGKIDAVVATSRSGNLYLRTRPDIAEENLEDMG
jgi:hypothetical protein